MVFDVFVIFALVGYGYEEKNAMSLLVVYIAFQRILPHGLPTTFHQKQQCFWELHVSHMKKKPLFSLKSQNFPSFGSESRRQEYQCRIFALDKDGVGQLGE